MKDMDITTIFLNLIDNAIEANTSLPSDKRYINLIIKNLQNHMVVNITNSYLSGSDTKTTTHFSFFKEHMGLGLENVKTALSRYNSTLVINQTDATFEVKFIISL